MWALSCAVFLFVRSTLVSLVGGSIDRSRRGTHSFLPPLNQSISGEHGHELPVRQAAGDAGGAWWGIGIGSVGLMGFFLGIVVGVLMKA